MLVAFLMGTGWGAKWTFELVISMFILEAPSKSLFGWGPQLSVTWLIFPRQQDKSCIRHRCWCQGDDACQCSGKQFRRYNKHLSVFHLSAIRFSALIAALWRTVRETVLLVRRPHARCIDDLLRLAGSSWMHVKSIIILFVGLLSEVINCAAKMTVGKEP